MKHMPGKSVSYMFFTIWSRFCNAFFCDSASSGWLLPFVLIFENFLSRLFSFDGGAEGEGFLVVKSSISSSENWGRFFSCLFYFLLALAT